MTKYEKPLHGIQLTWDVVRHGCQHQDSLRRLPRRKRQDHRLRQSHRSSDQENQASMQVDDHADKPQIRHFSRCPVSEHERQKKGQQILLTYSCHGKGEKWRHARSRKANLYFLFQIWWWHKSSINEPASCEPRRKIATDCDWIAGWTTMPIIPYSSASSRWTAIPPYSSEASHKHTIWAALRNTKCGKARWLISVLTHFGNFEQPPIYGIRLMWPRFNVKMPSWYVSFWNSWMFSLVRLATPRTALLPRRHDLKSSNKRRNLSFLKVTAVRVLEESLRSPNRKWRLILGVNKLLLESGDSTSKWHFINIFRVVEILDTMPCKRLQVGIPHGSAFTQMRDKFRKFILTVLSMLASCGSEIRRFSKNSINQFFDIERRLGWTDAVWHKIGGQLRGIINNAMIAG